MMGENVELSIERIVLHGFPPVDRRAIHAAIERELARLLAEQGVPPRLTSGGALARLDAGSFDVMANAAPDIVGEQIAQTLFRAFENS